MTLDEGAARIACMLETLRENLDCDPFVPFRIILIDGDRDDVTNPHMIALGETMAFYCYPRSDRTAWLRMNQIAAFETIAQAA
jgi:hypothetical protein